MPEMTAQGAAPPCILHLIKLYLHLLSDCKCLIFDETDIETRPSDHQCQPLLSHTLCSISTVCLTWKVLPTSTSTKLKYGKNNEENENSALRVNDPGMKSVPRWPLTRGRVIKTKGLEENTGTPSAAQVLPAPSQNCTHLAEPSPPSTQRSCRAPLHGWCLSLAPSAIWFPFKSKLYWCRGKGKIIRVII